MGRLLELAGIQRKPQLGPEAEQLLAGLHSDIETRAEHCFDQKPATWASVKAVAAASSGAAAELIQVVLAELGVKQAFDSNESCLRVEVYECTLQRLVKLEFELHGARLLLCGLPAMAEQCGPPSGTVISAVERALAAFPADATLTAAANELKEAALRTEYGPPTAEQRRLARRLEQALGASDDLRPEPGDPVGDAAIKSLEAMTAEARAGWQPMLALALQAGGSKPSKKFLNAARDATQAIGEEAFCSIVQPWFDALQAPAERLGWGEHPVSVANGDLLKGLVWAMATIDHPQKLPMLGELATRSLKKLPGYGPLCRKLGNACLLVLSQDGSRAAVQQLQVLLQGTRYAQVRTLIEKFLNEAAENAGLSRSDLDDLSVPDFGLDEEAHAEIAVGSCTAALRIESLHEVSITWHREDGKSLKSAPKAVREAHPDAVKQLKARVKEMKKALIAQRNRIESFWIEGREWSAPDFLERLIDHPFMGFFGKRLVWLASQPDHAETACCWADGALRDERGSEVALAADSVVRLWHPMLCEPEQVLAWRQRLAELAVTQPLKQAHREVYVLTAAELATDVYSNRFAAHILKQHQLQALCQERGWSYSLQGSFDGYNVPERRIESHSLCVEFVVSPILESEAMSESGIALYVSTDQVRFHSTDQVRAHSADDGIMPLSDVPPLLFSEVMREVDLFVGVASVGSDPNWVSGGAGWIDHLYWNGFAFGELSATAQTRRAVLAELIPALAIADQCHLGDRFLEVQGHYHSYKIHLGSGNIQIEPGSRYLCIVRAPSRSKGSSLKLPFDGDATLSLILSKAFLLADDQRITDPAILSQIR